MKISNVISTNIYCDYKKKNVLIHVTYVQKYTVPNFHYIMLDLN